MSDLRTRTDSVLPRYTRRQRKAAVSTMRDELVRRGWDVQELLRCAKCGWEAWGIFNDDGDEDCPHCGGRLFRVGTDSDIDLWAAFRKAQRVLLR